MKVIFKKNPNTEIFIIEDKSIKPFIFRNNSVKLDGILREALFKYHLTPSRQVSKAVSMPTNNENTIFEVPKHDIHNVRSILIDSLKR